MIDTTKYLTKGVASDSCNWLRRDVRSCAARGRRKANWSGGGVGRRKREARLMATTLPGDVAMLNIEAILRDASSCRAPGRDSLRVPPREPSFEALRRESRAQDGHSSTAASTVGKVSACRHPFPWPCGYCMFRERRRRGSQKLEHHQPRATRKSPMSA